MSDYFGDMYIKQYNREKGEMEKDPYKIRHLKGNLLLRCSNCDRDIIMLSILESELKYCPYCGSKLNM